VDSLGAWSIDRDGGLVRRDEDATSMLDAESSLIGCGLSLSEILHDVAKALVRLAQVVDDLLGVGHDRARY